MSVNLTVIRQSIKKNKFHHQNAFLIKKLSFFLLKEMRLGRLLGKMKQLHQPFIILNVYLLTSCPINQTKPVSVAVVLPVILLRLYTFIYEQVVFNVFDVFEKLFLLLSGWKVSLV